MIRAYSGRKGGSPLVLVNEQFCNISKSNMIIDRMQYFKML